jgi:uncharacterized protein
MTCPVCRKETVREFRPFCSHRCADLDLARWFRGDYRVATDEAPPDAETPLDTPRRLS